MNLVLQAGIAKAAQVVTSQKDICIDLKPMKITVVLQIYS